jgi:hypothetical protein|tara:strand:+ start:839 stop:1525 length:687 start_codon:yes stop_codon:yes gene_type:complete
MRRKSKGKHYFTKETEDAIVAYCATEDISIRSNLYIQQIQPAFNELVDKIVFTYKFNNLENIDYLKDDCKIWLTTILGKFNPNQGTKAFSYFSVVTKNWFTHKAKKQTQKNKREINYNSMIREVEAVTSENKKDFYDEMEDHQFWVTLFAEVKSWKTANLKPNEEKVINAVITIMDNVDQIEIFNKKAIYLYMREITGLNTKQIVSSLNKIRKKYHLFKQKWDQGEIN